MFASYDLGHKLQPYSPKHLLVNIEVTFMSLKIDYVYFHINTSLLNTAKWRSDKNTIFIIETVFKRRESQVHI